MSFVHINRVYIYPNLIQVYNYNFFKGFVVEIHFCFNFVLRSIMATNIYEVLYTKLAKKTR